MHAPLLPWCFLFILDELSVNWHFALIFLLCCCFLDKLSPDVFHSTSPLWNHLIRLRTHSVCVICPAALQCSSTVVIHVSLSFTVGTIDVGKARLMFWDLGGQDELQSLWDKVSYG